MILQAKKIRSASPALLRRFEQRMQSYRNPPQRPGYVIATIFGEFRYRGEKEIGGVSIYVANSKRRIRGRMICPSKHFAIWHGVNVSPVGYVLGGTLVKTYRSGWRPIGRSER